MKYFFTVTIIIFCFSFSVFAQQPKSEIRAIWLTTNYGLDWPGKPAKTQADVEKQKAELCDILDKVKRANLNIVFLQTRLRGDVIYPSKIEPQSSHISNSSFRKSFYYDPLEFAIEACHERGLECHAWFVTYPMGTSVSKKQKNNTLLQRHEGEYYLDPGIPETRTYLYALIDEIVLNYDIDGFHFDYVRYPDNADAFPDKKTFNKYGNKNSLKNWRRENINQFVYQAYDRIKYAKPWVQVSSSVVGMYERVSNKNAYRTAFSGVYQDPADWVAKGKHDFIVPMMYYSDDLFFPFIENWVTRCNGRWIVPGIGVYRLDKKDKDWDVKIILDQIAYSRDNQAGGNAYFRAQQLIENQKDVLSQIETQFYQYPATLPPLVWLDSIPPVKPLVPSAVREKDAMLLSWEKSQDIDEEIYYNIYCSETYPIDMENPKNLLRTRLLGTELSVPIQKEKEYGYYYAITASDRFHNESIISEPVYFCVGDFEK